METCGVQKAPTLDDLFAADEEARRVTQDFLQEIGG